MTKMQSQIKWLMIWPTLMTNDVLTFSSILDNSKLFLFNLENPCHPFFMVLDYDTWHNKSFHVAFNCFHFLKINYFATCGKFKPKLIFNILIN